MSGRKKHLRGSRASRSSPPGTPTPSAPEQGCDALEALLGSDARTRILEAAATDLSFTVALVELRDAFRSHRFRVPDGLIDLAPWVIDLDRRTRREGFRVLQAWDHVAQRFTPDDVPVMLLEYYDYLRKGRGTGRASPAILLDFYLLHLLALLAMRAWDTSHPDRILDRIQHLVDLLQGPEGSGHQFLSGPGTLIILAVSHFHPRDAAYDQLIERIRGLPPRQRVAFARVSAGVLAAHLRWGISQMYEWDVPRMREDNVGDYPWLLFTAATLMDAFASMEPGDPLREVVGADLLNALTADPEAFAGEPPRAFLPYPEEYARFREQFKAAAPALRELFHRLRPRAGLYSPLSFHFNFPHNTVVAGTTLALLEQAPGRLPLDALLLTRPGDIPPAGATGEAEGSGAGREGERQGKGTLAAVAADHPGEKGGQGAASELDPPGREEAPEGSDTRRALARALMLYAGARPERLEARGARLILYDPQAGDRIVARTLDTLFRE